MPGDKTVGVPGSTRLEQHTDGGGGVKSGTTIPQQEVLNTAPHDRIDVEASIYDTTTDAQTLKGK